MLMSEVEVLLAIFLLFACLWITAAILVAKFGGWKTLAIHYAASSAKVSAKFSWVSLILGKSWLGRYGACAKVQVAEEGVAFSLMFPFGIAHRSFVIPWSAISSIEHAETGSRVVVNLGHESPVDTIEIEGPRDLADEVKQISNPPIEQKAS